MEFSVLATFTGSHKTESFYDTGPSDVRRAWFEATGERTDWTDPGDSEYSYLADEGSPDDEWAHSLQDCQVSVESDHVAELSHGHKQWKAPALRRPYA